MSLSFFYLTIFLIAVNQHAFAQPVTQEINHPPTYCFFDVVAASEHLLTDPLPYDHIKMGSLKAQAQVTLFRILESKEHNWQARCNALMILHEDGNRPLFFLLHAFTPAERVRWINENPLQLAGQDLLKTEMTMLVKHDAEAVKSLFRYNRSVPGEFIPLLTKALMNTNQLTEFQQQALLFLALRTNDLISNALAERLNEADYVFYANIPRAVSKILKDSPLKDEFSEETMIGLVGNILKSNKITDDFPALPKGH